MIFLRISDPYFDGSHAHALEVEFGLFMTFGSFGAQSDRPAAKKTLNPM